MGRAKGGNDVGILTQAIQLQQDGAKYYTEQAERHAQNAMKDVFLLLAEDEKLHAMILQASRDQLPYELQDNGISKKVADLFQSLETQKEEIPAPTEQADVYGAAWEMEKKAVALYEQLLENTDKPDEKALYAFLIDQEKMHAEVMENIYRHINRPNEWVEAAEFGLREEY